jgi:hypothetical protein
VRDRARKFAEDQLKQGMFRSGGGNFTKIADEWQAYWQLYCLRRLAIKDREKLFESEFASLIAESTA